MKMNRKVYFNPAFREVNECIKRYVLMKGSAGSGKSVDVAQDYITKLSNPKYKGANLLCVRKIDESNREEVAIFGHGRKFYPLEPISAEGGQKIPTSYVSNNGFRTNLGIKNFSGFKDKPYIRNEFKNRVLYLNND